MKYSYNCKNCVNRVIIADNRGFLHEFCKIIYADKKRPIHYSRMKQEVSCEEYKEERCGSG